MSEETDPLGSEHSAASGLDIDNLERLLGPKVPASSEKYAILRIPMRIYGQHFIDRSQLITRMGVQVPSHDLNLSTDIAESSSYIFGPFSEKEVQELLEGQLLSGVDELQFSGGRWRKVKDLYPEQRAKFWRATENTGTHTLTNTVTNTANAHFEENTSTDPRVDTELSGERVPLERVVDDVAQEIVAEERTRTSQQPPLVATTSKLSVPISRGRTQTSPKNQVGLLAAAVVVLGGTFWFLTHQKQKNFETDHKTSNTQEEHENLGVVAEVLPSQRPESLKERELFDVYWSSSPLLEKLKPAFEAWSREDLFQLAAHEDILKRFSSPAVASWDARRLATHLYVNLKVWKEDYRGAEGLLQEIYQAAPGDLYTLSNLAGLSIVLGRYPEARDFANLVERGSGVDLRWLAWVQTAMAETMLGHATTSENAWRSAYHATPENPWIPLGNLATLLKQKENSQRAWNEVLQRLMQSDPVYIFEKPKPKGILFSFLTPPYHKTWWLQLESRWSQLKLPQDDFARVQDLFGMSQNALSVKSTGIKELKDLVDHYKGAKFVEIFESRKSIEKILSADGVSRLVWPWTLLGDAALEQKDFVYASFAYQNALDRDSTSLGALWGLASVALEKGDWMRAESLLRQVEAAARDYPPAQQRIKRVEYLKRLGGFFR